MLETAVSEALRPVDKADLFKLKFLQNAKLSPDGKRIVYAVTHVDEKEDKEYATLWLMDAGTGEARQLTAGTARDAGASWSPDGTRIAFLSTRTGSAQIFVIPVDGGEARQVTTLKLGTGGAPVWSPDGQHLAFTASPLEEARKPELPYRVTRQIYRFNGMEYLDDSKQDIYVVPASGGEARRLTTDATQKAGLRWSPDGSEIMYLGMLGPDSSGIYPKLYAVNLDGSSRPLVAPEWGDAVSGAWLPDGRVVFIGKPTGRPIGSKPELWLVGRDGQTPECRSEKLRFSVGGGLQPDMPSNELAATGVLVTKDGKGAYATVQEGGMVHIYRFALEGPESWIAVLSGERACLLLDVGEAHLLFAESNLLNPLELHIAELDGADERTLTHVNDEFLSGLALPTVEHLLFPGVDGTLIEGWALKPAAGEAPYPTVLYIHGGPHSAFGHMFSFDFHMLAGAGYAVLIVNQRGSTGYGDDFANAILGDWGNLDYADLMSGVDYAIAQGISDPDRLGVCGLSGGGNLSSWIVGQTRRFKAAVPENPVTNWVSFYGVSDIGPWFAVEELGGHPWEIPDVYHRCSPITYAHTCTTPTLLVQCEHDWRCPPEQSEQFYNTLKVVGCPVEMLRVPNEAHAGCIGGALAARRAQNDALLGWMNRWVLGQA
jgi:dipeptidyl aminopeptidase/acylaminoacyl peptidase